MKGYHFFVVDAKEIGISRAVTIEKYNKIAPNSTNKKNLNNTHKKENCSNNTGRTEEACIMDSNTPNKNVTNDVDIPPEASESEKDNMGDERNEIRRPKKIHKLSLKVTEDFNKKLKKRGVIYIARVPPRMTPSKLKSLLSDFGEVTRIFLVEEDASKRKRRRKEFGNSGGKRYGT